MADTKNDDTMLCEFRKMLFEMLGSKSLGEITAWVGSIQQTKPTSLTLSEQLDKWLRNQTPAGRVHLLARSLQEQVNCGTIYEWTLFRNLYAIRLLLEESKEELEEVQIGFMMEWVQRLEEIIWDDIHFLWIPNQYEYTFIFRRHNLELGSAFQCALKEEPSDCAEMFWSNILQIADAMTKVKGARTDGTLVPDCQAKLLAYQQG